MHGTLDPQEWYDLNRFALKLRNAEGPVLSLYLPSYEIADGKRMLDKDDVIIGLEGVRQAIVKKIEKVKYHSGSICVFGWSKNGRSVVEHFAISKELPPLYVVLRKPYLKPLRDILEIGYHVVVIIMDHKKARIELFSGSELIEEMSVTSYLKGRHSKGGWSQKRFQQNRELLIKHFFSKVSGRLNSLEEESIDLILLGGSGLAKKKFIEVMTEELAKKTFSVDGISFDTPRRRITRYMISFLDRSRKAGELKLLSGLAGPVKHGLVIVDNRRIEKKLAGGAVDVLFIAADYYATTPEENSAIRRMIRMAKKQGATIEFITGANARKRLHSFGNVVALLRYK